jgi:hypothetical protein
MTDEFKPAQRTHARQAGAGVLPSSGATPGIGGESLNTAAEFRSRPPTGVVPTALDSVPCAADHVLVPHSWQEQ